MANRVRDAAAPAYLFACLIAGGSAQGVWTNMVLQLVGVALIAWAALAPSPGPALSSQRQLLGIVLLVLALIALQCVPLPPAVWSGLGGRQALVDGFRTLGIALPWMPLSLAPYDTLTAALSLIPGLALLAAALRLGSRPLWLTLALVAGTFAGIVLGALQVSSPDPSTSSWYLYEQSNFGVATGFFANANHMADLLVITVPFLAAALASAGRGTGKNVQRYSGALALVAGAVLVIAVGIALNGSLAGYGLALPVLLASAAIALPGRGGSLRWLAPVAGVALIAAVGWLATTPLSNSATLRSNATTSVQSREEILHTTLKATAQFMPLGAGVGTFARVYALVEDHDRLDPTVFVNHAHDDYAEIALEAGIPGLVILALFLLWWARAAWTAWRTSEPDPYARAAAVASAAILVHSLVDFPLRTAAIGACFALCLALLVWRRPAPAAEPSELRPARHVVVG